MVVYREPRVIFVEQRPVVVWKPRPRVVYQRQPVWLGLPGQINIVIPIEID
jgi:hypothetical protein